MGERFTSNSIWYRNDTNGRAVGPRDDLLTRNPAPWAGLGKPMDLRSESQAKESTGTQHFDEATLSDACKFRMPRKLSSPSISLS